MLRLPFYFFPLFITATSFAQNISGTWTGNYGKSLLMMQPEKVVVEIFLHDDSLISGLSHLYYTRGRYEHYKINGVFHKKDSVVYFWEDSTIAVKLGLAYNCLGNYTVALHISGGTMKLTGKWRDNSRGFFHCPASTVWFEKPFEVSKLATEHRMDSVAVTDSKPPVNKETDRKLDVQSLIEIPEQERDSIKVEIYDNAEIDNDSVSVYFENTLIVNRQMISLTPITFYVSFNNNNPLSKIKLVAESLGSIPPCTALMIITTKKKRYEVSLSSNFNKTATVEFFLKE